MGKLFDSKPAKFPKNNSEEYNSVIKLLDILDKNRIKPDPKLIDKFPNTDGEITVVDELQHPIGKCEIQIKTLPDTKVKTPKYQCDLPFLSHCETSLLPVILIAVNAQSEIAYWLHIDRITLEDLSKKIKGDSISVSFPFNNQITRTEKKYIDEWTGIIEKYIERKLESEALEKYKKKYEELIEIVKSYPRPQHSIGIEDLKSLNIFIDTLNNSFDIEFLAIKEVVFPGFWKISITYTDFDENRLSFAIIPIQYGENDLLLREMTSMTPIIRDRMARNIISHYMENPIKKAPVEYAFSLIKNETLEVIEKRYLKLICNPLVFESLTEFYDYSHSILPFELKDYFDIKDFAEVINDYIPIWVEEFSKISKNVPINNTLYFDIENVFWCNFPEDLDKVTEIAKARFSKNEFSEFKIQYINKEFSIEDLKDSLEFLKNQELSKFKRPFPSKSYDKPSGFVYSWYTPDTAFEKLRFVYSELPKVYDLFIKTYFNKLYEDLRYYCSFDLLIVNINYGTIFKALSDSPSIELYYLKSIEESKPDTRLFLNSEECPLSRTNHYEAYNNGIEIDGIKYKLISSSFGIIDGLYDKSTLQTLLYKTLKSRFEDYFKTKTSNKYG
ncbi:DUF4365 domain-containing protein [Fulvivirgaceae bacterium BMA12]|uniref:DUF4365 domain-containing protein n=1 Tax=Agaribacillus aureus TaxID=3051825 RepID=A0ABT8LBC7_9BACT|nr:DUF4365 domain-containing protein [Fulvivirgaceae bacterium BMA12]